jgi:hypothetical protein
MSAPDKYNPGRQHKPYVQLYQKAPPYMAIGQLLPSTNMHTAVTTKASHTRQLSCACWKSSNTTSPHAYHIFPMQAASHLKSQHTVDMWPIYLFHSTTTTTVRCIKFPAEHAVNVSHGFTVPRKPSPGLHMQHALQTIMA